MKAAFELYSWRVYEKRRKVQYESYTRPPPPPPPPPGTAPPLFTKSSRPFFADITLNTIDINVPKSANIMLINQDLKYLSQSEMDNTLNE